MRLLLGLPVFAGGPRCLCLHGEQGLQLLPSLAPAALPAAVGAIWPRGLPPRREERVRWAVPQQPRCQSGRAGFPGRRSGSPPFSVAARRSFPTGLRWCPRASCPSLCSVSVCTWLLSLAPWSFVLRQSDPHVRFSCAPRSWERQSPGQVEAGVRSAGTDSALPGPSGRGAWFPHRAYPFLLCIRAVSLGPVVAAPLPGGPVPPCPVAAAGPLVCLRLWFLPPSLYLFPLKLAPKEFGTCFG